MLRRICAGLAVVASALVLGASPASGESLADSQTSATSAGWQSAGYYNNSLSCDIAGANGKAQGRWTDYACVPTSGGRWLLMVNVP